MQNAGNKLIIPSQEAEGEIGDEVMVNLTGVIQEISNGQTTISDIQVHECQPVDAEESPEPEPEPEMPEEEDETMPKAIVMIANEKRRIGRGKK